MNSKIKYILVFFLFVFIWYFTKLFRNEYEGLNSIIATVDQSGNSVDQYGNILKKINTRPHRFDLIESSNKDPGTIYTTDKDVQYHNDITDKSDEISKGTWVKDPSGNLVFVPWTDPSQNMTYYTSGAYPYGASTYVPNYEDSIYLSKTTGQSTLSNVYPTSNSLGICNNNTGIDNKAKMEQSCNVLSSDVCASTTCCVLLGGSKCVSGSERGPYMSANYSDPFIKNKDYYFYSGRCYGNCP